MEKELFFSGYCRVLDGSRTVACVFEDGALTEADCCYGGCLHEPNCEIAKKIRAELNENP